MAEGAVNVSPLLDTKGMIVSVGSYTSNKETCEKYMNQTEQAALISQLRKQAENDQNILYQRATGQRCEKYFQYPESEERHHGLSHLVLFLCSLCVLFFAVDYFDTKHDYAAAISHAVTSNQTVRETYDKIENSDFINWITEWVTPLVHKQE